MIVNLETSAIVAIILGEPEQLALRNQLEQSDSVFCPAACVLEAVIVLVRKQKMTTAQAKELVFQLLSAYQIEISSLDEPALIYAIEAYGQYGIGRNVFPALLNFGDCLAYGTTKASGRKLLFTGDDFAQTDLA
jgi:ribonuclease VapC